MSSSHYDRQNNTTVPPEIPRRGRSSRPTRPSSGHVREIHKNAWLKHFCQNEKKGFIKKYEKHWVAFCVHDDVEAVLEFYTDPKVAVAHKPSQTMSLNECLHVSQSIMGQDNEYEFAIVLPTHTTRLVAANWEQMTEWVESLQGKLREMNILKPKDNLYSKMPELPSVPGPAFNFPSARFPNTTRDPNSPLPPPPTPVRVEESSASTALDQQTTLRIPVMIDSQPLAATSGPSNCVIPSTQIVTRNNETAGVRHVQNLLVDTTTTPLPLNVQPNNNSTISQSSNLEAEALITISSCENLVNLTIGGDIVTHPMPSSSQSMAGPVVVNSVPNLSNTVHITFDDSSVAGQQQQSSCSTLTQNGNNNLSMSSLSFVTKCPISSTACLLSSSHLIQPNKQFSLPLQSASNESRSASRHESSAINPMFERQHSAPCQVQRSNSHENLYEHLFIPSSMVVSSATASVTALKTFCPVSTTSKDVKNNNISVQDEEGSVPPLIPRRNPNPKKVVRDRTSPGQQRSSSLSRLQQQGNVASSNGSRGSRDHRNGESSATSSSHRNCARRVDVIRSIEPCPPETSSAHSSSHQFDSSNTIEIRPMDAMIGFRKGEYRIRRDDFHNGDLEGGRTPSTRTTNGAYSISHIPLKEQQVMRLKAEINNAVGGVRIVLRKKDCIDSIAFVDYLGAVWIAGYKQLQQPVLYYAFHIGDQIMKVAGVNIHNSSEAYRAIKMATSMQVEFIIRRLPYGKVLVLKRKKGEPLGLISTGNSGEIEVEENGLAANHGLPSYGPTAADAQSTCNWWLTEINNRPLSLFAQKNEIKERLNPVGNEASILVQPADLVKQLRKQLKSIKNFKEYLV